MTNFPALAIGSAAVLGLLIGSFLNVVILRLPKRMYWFWERDSREFLKSIAKAPSPEEGKSDSLPTSTTDAPPGIVVERSHCPKCGHRISALENIPLISYMMLGGKCRSCKTKISWQYPFVEALTGFLFALVVWQYGISAQSIILMIATAYLVAMSGIDARTTLLPDSLTLQLLWLGLIVSTQSLFIPPADAVLGAAAGYLSLWGVYWAYKLLTGKDGMGFGDFKLLAAIGAFCGWKAILPVLLMSSAIGAIAGIGLIAIRGRNRGNPIPFGPYLAAAGFVQMLYGDSIIYAYLAWASTTG